MIPGSLVLDGASFGDVLTRSLQAVGGSLLFVAVIFSGFPATLVSMLILRKASRFLGLVDEPGGRHQHVKPTPKVGGLAILVGVMLTFLVVDHREFNMRVLWGGLAIAGLGLLDDYLRDRFPWSVKLLCQASVAIWFAYPYGTPYAIWASLLLVVAVNAMNFMDHANGMLAMAAMPGIVCLPGWTANVFGGAIVVFLLFNFSGRVFAGDVGSHFLGFVLPASALEQTAGVDTHANGGYAAPGLVNTPNFALALLVLTLPLADAAVVILIRLWNRTPPWHSTPDHLDHRWRRRATLPMGGMLGAFFWSASFLIVFLVSRFREGTPILIPTAAAICIVLMGAPLHAPMTKSSRTPQNPPRPVET